jgi:thioredoxin-like negative regulator of GroEL
MFESLTQFDLHHRVAEQRTPTLVFFSSVGCGACRHLKTSLTSVKARRPDWQIFEVDAQHEMGLTREFEVFHLPSLFLFADGQYHAQLHCEAVPGKIEHAVEQALKQPAEDAP